MRREKEESSRMPPILRSATEAKLHVLESSKKWRAEFPKTKLVKDLTVSCARCLDDMTAGQVFAIEAIQQMENNTAKAISIAQKNEQALKDAAKELDKLKKQVKELQSAQEKTDKTVEETSQKQKTNITKVQQIQLAQSENVLICRNIKPITKNKTESYEEPEAAFSRAVREILSHDVKVAHVKRLQKVKGDTSRGSSTMRVELANRGDKIKIFHAVEHMVKNQEHFDYTFTNEIPQYALNAYKHINKVALVVRQSHKGMKSRVTINPGDHWPSLMVRKDNQSNYVKIDDEMYKEAKAKVIQ